MPTATEKTTRELVEEQFDAGVEDAKAIAKKIKKEPATVYVHLRNIRQERGIPSRGRGRPPRVQADGDGNGKAPTPRKAPPRAGQAKTTKAETPAKAKGKPGRPKGSTNKTAPAAPAPAAEKAHTNGHTPHSEFPEIEKTIRTELKEAQRRVRMLEGMLKPFES